MADIARLFRLDGWPPFIRLILSVCILVVSGTLFFFLFLVLGSLIFGVDLSVMGKITSPLTNDVNSHLFRYIQFSQEVGVFLLPSLMLAWLLKGERRSYLRIERYPLFTGMVLVILLVILAIPVIEYAGVLNSRMVLPESMSGLQDHLRLLEEKASRLTGILIASDGPGIFALNILILAVLPALCEEFLFRGILQQLLGDLFRSAHAAIWVTAIIFSAVHLQFYGFIPRMMLGLLFGYLFWWSGNMWFPVMAHFLNNAIPVTFSYFSGMNAAAGGLTKGKESLSFPFVAIILSVLVLIFFYRESIRRPLSSLTSSRSESNPSS